jgi:predicted nucleic acid-binding Zn ribbon protein
MGRDFQGLPGLLVRWAAELPEERRAEVAWVVAVGPEICAHTRVLGVERGVVRVEAEGEAWAGSVRSLSEEILRSMNALAGKRLYRGIRVEEGAE